MINKNSLFYLHCTSFRMPVNSFKYNVVLWKTEAVSLFPYSLYSEKLGKNGRFLLFHVSLILGNKSLSQ
jgi:hypothetical protein